MLILCFVVVEDVFIVLVVWVCGYVKVFDKMKVLGIDKIDIFFVYLLVNCV